MRQVNLVNHIDEVIGQTDLLDAHRGDGKKHQAVSLFLFQKKTNGSFELLIQQRSSKKIVGALQWANTLCANLLPGENHWQALDRRLFEELGIRWNNVGLLKKVMVFDYQIPCENGFCENEIDHIFTSVLDEKLVSNLEISPNPDEVAAIDWVNWNDIKLKQVRGKRLTPWFNLFLDNQSLIKKINEVLKI